MSILVEEYLESENGNLVVQMILTYFAKYAYFQIVVGLDSVESAKSIYVGVWNFFKIDGILKSI